MLWNATRAMCEDARRRFVFSFTVASSAMTMHLWYASRADIVMSESFNFMDVRASLSLSHSEHH